MASYDPYDVEGGFRLAAPLLERVLWELDDVLVEAHVCRAFHAACVGRARGSCAEVVSSIERLAWARARGCRYSPEALATAAAQGGLVDVLLLLEGEIRAEDATWRSLGALAAIAQQWEVVRLAFARCPDQHEFVLAAATSAGRALVPPDQVARIADLVPPRAAIATADDQAQWLGRLSARDRERVVERHAGEPMAATMLNYAEWLAGSVECSERAEPGERTLMISRSADIITNIRPLGDYEIAIRMCYLQVQSAPLSRVLVPSQYLGCWGVYICLVGDGPPDWGISYQGLYLPPRGRASLHTRVLVDGDSWYSDGCYRGTFARGIEYLMKFDERHRTWMRRAGMLSDN